MKVFLRNGFLVAEWEGKPNKPLLNNNDLVSTLPKNGWEFFNSLRSGKYDLGEPYIDLRYGVYKLSYKPYRAYKALWWVVYWAIEHYIEVDESVKQVYEVLRKEYQETYAKMEEAYVARAIERAEVKWNETHEEEVFQGCGYCRSCADGIDGELYCEKFRKYIEVNVGENVTLAGEHLMYASHGMKLDECKALKAQEKAQEKELYIYNYVNEFKRERVEEMVAEEMNKKGIAYV